MLEYASSLYLGKGMPSQEAVYKFFSFDPDEINSQSTIAFRNQSKAKGLTAPQMFIASQAIYRQVYNLPVTVIATSIGIRKILIAILITIVISALQETSGGDDSNTLDILISKYERRKKRAKTVADSSRESRDESVIELRNESKGDSENKAEKEYNTPEAPFKIGKLIR